MSQLSDALHDAIVTAARPFVGPIGADLISTALETLGSIVPSSEDPSTEE